jgi:ubiquinone/menaquinone biosynthesis C-methylase UbiE
LSQTYFHPPIQKNAASHGISFSILCKEADNTGLPDNYAEIDISTPVLCSVKNPVKVMKEVKRILKPGGGLFL